MRHCSPESLRALPPLSAIRAEIARREAERRRLDVERNAEAIRERCKSFAGFVREAWRILEPSTRYVHNWHIDAICAHLEAVTDGRITRLLINVPPGSMKSMLVSVLWQAWEWGPKGMRSMRYLSTAFNDGPVTRDVRKCRDLMLSEWYRSLWPEVVLTRTAETSFANSQTGTREGIAFGSLTSQRGDRLIIDDPHSTETAESDAERQRTTRKFREGATDRLNDIERSAIVVIMQRLHEGDISGTIISLGMEYVHLMLPMEFEPERAQPTVIGFLDPRSDDGDLLDPIRFPRAAIDKLKRDKGEYAYAGQYQQRPVGREGGLFKREWLIPVDAIPPRESLRVYGGSDYAVTSKGGDFTVHAVVGLDPDGDPWLLEIWRKQASSDVWVATFCDLVIKWKPMAWAEESGQIKSGVGPFLEREMRARGAYTAREQFPTRGDKAVRAQSFRGLIATRGLRVPASAAWRVEFEAEMMLFPAGVHDDQVDALGLIGQLLDTMLDGQRPKEPQMPRDDGYRSNLSSGYRDLDALTM